MPPSPTVPLSRAWNTWSGRPAEMVFLPLGVRIAPLAYAASIRKASLFAAGEAVLGQRAIDASLVELELAHAGTRLAWSYRKSDPFGVAGSWRTVTLGEWGLRFWICLCVSADGGEDVWLDPESGAALVQIGRRFVAVVMATPPALVTGHDTTADLAAEYEQHGYWHLAARADRAKLLALRCNLEMHREQRFAAAVADRADLAIDAARRLLNASAPEPALPGQDGRFAGALDAVRDVVGWNTVWDAVNRRPYISLSRNWDAAKFGGFGVWLDDQFYAAGMASCLDADVARETLNAALDSATPGGNLACLVTANDAWVDRSQIPVGSFAAWQVAQRGSRDVLEIAYPVLAANHRWWWRARDPDGTGLASYGTSDVGTGLYKGTHFGARNESSMDNAPFHDEAVFDPATGLLDLMDVGLNAMLALDAEILALIAAELGMDKDAAWFAARAEATRRKIRAELWDESRAIFANRARDGRFVRSLGATSFYPLAAGAATEVQAEHMLRHLHDPARFGGRFTVPSVSRDDPAFADNTYWRGRIWPPMNFWVWQGLRRYRRDAAAAQLADASMVLFHQSWDTRRLCPENFNATTGEALDQPDTDGFYIWGALMPMLGVAEITDVSPWDGWSITHPGANLNLGPIRSPAGAVTLRVTGGVLTLARGDTWLLRTDVVGRFRHLGIAPGQISVELPPTSGGFVRLPHARVLLCRLGEQIVEPKKEADGLVLSIDPSEKSRTLLVVRDL